MINIAIFASGTGSNADALLKQFSVSNHGKVRLVLSDKHLAGVHEVARLHNVKSVLISLKDAQHQDLAFELLKEHQIDLIFLAGFLKPIPVKWCRSFEDKIFNIHPALLPKFGGKGMYGHHVHQAVHQAKETESGITIHQVNEHYDEGKIIFQRSFPITQYMTPQDIESNVRRLELMWYPVIADGLAKELNLTSEHSVA